jgi:hypothetical protein
MRRPRLSTGAWIFTGLICASLIAPAGVYAASVAKVVLATPTGTTAAITPQHQLLTTTIPSSRVVRVVGGSISVGCKSIYTPPKGKAIVVTSATYTYGSGTTGNEHFGGLGPASCSTIYDQIDTAQAYDTVQHTWPTGLPLPSVGISNSGAGLINVFIVGYLVDASALPARTAMQQRGTVKALSPTR